MRAMFAVFFAMLLAASCGAAESCPPTSRQDEWSSSCFEGTGSARHVKREHMANIVADKTGHATIRIEESFELLAVNRRGEVVVPNIRHTGDFDYPTARSNLGRFQHSTPDGKCGYFDGSTFKIVIPAIYDHCMSFGETHAEVCNDCQVYCTEPECQNSRLIGGQGYAIDRRNRIVRRFALPSLEQACRTGPAKLTRLPSSSTYLQCPEDADGPFGRLR